MMGAARGFVHQLADIYGVNSVSYGADPKRYVRLSLRTGGSSRPKTAGASGISGGSNASLSSTDGVVVGEGVGSTGATSSIGSLLEPGVVILPSMTLTEAVAAFGGPLPSSTASGAATRLSAGGGTGVPPPLAPGPGIGAASGGATTAGRSFAAALGGRAPTTNAFASLQHPFGGGGSSSSSGSSGLVPVHPSEPKMADMDHAQVGAVLHVYGIRKSTRESDIRDYCIGGAGASGSSSIAAAAAENGYKRFRRLDDHNALLIFDTQGRARRALETMQSMADRGAVVPCKVRYWGVGVEQAMMSASAATAGSGAGGGSSSVAHYGAHAAAASSSAARPPTGGGGGTGRAWGPSGASSSSTTGSTSFASMAARGKVSPAPSKPSTTNRYAALVEDDEDEGAAGRGASASGRARGHGSFSSAGSGRSGDVHADGPGARIWGAPIHGADD